MKLEVDFHYQFLTIKRFVTSRILRSGGDPSALKELDGVSHWNTILYDKPSARNHILHNIDDQLGYAAIRKEKWKLVKGTAHFRICQVSD